MLELTKHGLYCAAGDFYVDPWPDKDARIERAVITHAHADHARGGSMHYLATPETAAIMHARISPDLSIQTLGYGKSLRVGDTEISLHPAGHVLGSAQLRVASDKQVWVASGDYKRDPDPSCEPFEVVPCDTFITEATFALPIYRWRSGAEVAADIFQWWEKNAAERRTSVLFAYAFGKAQRVLAELSALTQKTVFVHGAVATIVNLYRDMGITMCPTALVSEVEDPADFETALVIAPPSAAGSTWMRRFKHHSTGFVSGWMRVRGNRRRRGYDRGFVLSDHADWPGLINTIRDTGASRVLATHGKTDVLVRFLQESGIEAEPLVTRFGEEDAT